jgi:hypothetical protein
MKRFVTISLAVLGVLGLFAPAWANEEMHPGGRLFYPLWDVSTSSRVTFIIITRLALNDNNSIVGSINSTSFNTTRNFRPKNSDDNCGPKGAGGSETNVNRTDLGGNNDSPVFVDDVHLEYYGKNCDSGDETIHMSCADIDLLFLSSTSPRKGFSNVASQGQGAVDVHRIVNGSLTTSQREDENALMGHAVIVDITEGWAATYPAAAAKVTECAGFADGDTGNCSSVDGGTNFGYEAYPLEVYLPFAFADGFTNSGAFKNLLSLWAPGLMPGTAAGRVNLDIKWWDGRERPFTASLNRHALIDTLSTISSGQFNLSNFICGHTSDPNIAENDGFPRDGTQPCAGAVSAAPDPTHKSDNFETGIQLQSSTPLGWWRFNKIPSGPAPTATLPRLGTGATALPAQFDGKGLVGVVLSSAAPTASAPGIGDATRLWHKDPCQETTHGVLRGFGPPHLRDIAATLPADGFNDELEEGDTVVFFNAYGPGQPDQVTGSELGQQQICKKEMFNYAISESSQ